MYQIAIFKIRPEPDSTGYRMNYPAGTGYLNICCIAIFWFLCGVNKKVLFLMLFVFSFVWNCIGLRLFLKELVYMTHSLQEYKSLVL